MIRNIIFRLIVSRTALSCPFFHFLYMNLEFLPTHSFFSGKPLIRTLVIGDMAIGRYTGSMHLISMNLKFLLAQNAIMVGIERIKRRFIEFLTMVWTCIL